MSIFDDELEIRPVSLEDTDPLIGFLLKLFFFGTTSSSLEFSDSSSYLITVGFLDGLKYSDLFEFKCVKLGSNDFDLSSHLVHEIDETVPCIACLLK